MFPTTNPFPIYALPPSLYDAICEVQSIVQSPIEIVFGSAIGALSLVCQDQYNVRRPNGLESPCSLFLITIAESGERKTTTDRLFAKPIRDFETASEVAAEKAQEQYHADFQAWSVKAKALRVALSNLTTKEVTDAE